MNSKLCKCFIVKSPTEESQGRQSFPYVPHSKNIFIGVKNPLKWKLAPTFSQAKLLFSSGLYMPCDIHVTSLDEIKPGDWCLLLASNGEPFSMYPQRYMPECGHVLNSGHVKVIASTNPELCLPAVDADVVYQAFELKKKHFYSFVAESEGSLKFGNVFSFDDIINIEALIKCMSRLEYLGVSVVTVDSSGENIKVSELKDRLTFMK